MDPTRNERLQRASNKKGPAKFSLDEAFETVTA
jgi:hypothetical protein